jgi:hypothetical protein
MEQTNTTERKARCTYFRGCGGEQPSANPLPFFRPRPDAEFDSYYCGCYGWD